MKKIIALAALAALSAGASAANLLNDGSFEQVHAGRRHVEHRLDAAWLVLRQLVERRRHRRHRSAQQRRGHRPGRPQLRRAGRQRERLHLADVQYRHRQDLRRVVLVLRPRRRRRELAGLRSEHRVGRHLRDRRQGRRRRQRRRLATRKRSRSWRRASTPRSRSRPKARPTAWARRSTTSTFSAIPEPATLGLFAAGLAMLGMSARRRKQ